MRLPGISSLKFRKKDTKENEERQISKAQNTGTSWAAQRRDKILPDTPARIPQQFAASPATKVGADPHQLADQLNGGVSNSFKRTSITVLEQGKPDIINRPRPNGPQWSLELPGESVPAPPEEQPNWRQMPVPIDNHIAGPTASRQKVTPNDPGRTFHSTPNDWTSSPQHPSSPLSFSAFQTEQQGFVNGNDRVSLPQGNPDVISTPKLPQADADASLYSVTRNNVEALPKPEPPVHDGMARTADTAMMGANAAWRSSNTQASSNHNPHRKAVGSSNSGSYSQAELAHNSQTPYPQGWERTQAHSGHSGHIPENHGEAFLDVSNDYSGDELNSGETWNTQTQLKNGPYKTFNSPRDPASAGSEIEATDNSGYGHAASDDKTKWRLGSVTNRLSRQPKEAPQDLASDEKDEKKTEKRAKEALKPFRVSKMGGLTHLDTLFAWFPAELDRRQKAYIEAENSNMRLQKNLKEIRKANEDLEKEIAKTQGLQRIISELKGQQLDLRSSLSSMGKDRDAWRQESESTKRYLVDAQAKTQRSASEMAQLRSQWQAAAGETQRCMERNRGLDTELRNLETRFAALEVEKNNLVSQLASETRRLEQEKLHETTLLSNRLESETRRLEQEKRQETSKLIDRLASETHRLEKEKAEETSALRYQQERAGIEHEQAIVSLQVIMRDAESQHRREKSKLEKSVNARIAQETRHLSGTVKSLNNTIAAHRKDSWRPIPDDQLQVSFQKVVQKVNNLVGFVPKPATLGFTGNGIQSYDSTGYFARSAQGASGSRAWPRFIKTLCWSVYFNGFFRLQPGFGILGGSGEGHQMMQALYELKTVEPTGEEPEGMLFPLRNDKDTNTWRASFFDDILRNVKNHTATDQDGKLASLFHANVTCVSEELIDALQRVSGGRLDAGGPAHIHDMSRELGLLALQMGSQKAHLTLGMATQGQRLKGGSQQAKMFKDETGAGSVTPGLVEATTQPCFMKLGDGTDDMTTESVIVIGQIVSSGPPLGG